MMQNVRLKLNPESPWLKQHSARRKHFHQEVDLNFRKELVKCYIWSIALYGPEIWTLRKVYQNYLEMFEMWCWRRLEISPIIRKMNKCYKDSRRWGISYKQ